jgi:hypothetical protein
MPHEYGKGGAVLLARAFEGLFGCAPLSGGLGLIRLRWEKRAKNGVVFGKNGRFLT